VQTLLAKIIVTVILSLLEKVIILAREALTKLIAKKKIEDKVEEAIKKPDRNEAADRINDIVNGGV
jgi:hypothetical protein